MKLSQLLTVVRGFLTFVGQYRRVQTPGCEWHLSTLFDASFFDFRAAYFLGGLFFMHSHPPNRQSICMIGSEGLEKFPFWGDVLT